jgi:TIR domain
VSGSAHVFVSYRREDTRHLAGRLADRLVERFQVFMDMDTIEPGTDFSDVIKRAVNDCDVFVSIIGTQWTTTADENGRPRLDDPDDWVVAEIAAALQRKVPVIPVLVDGARMPTRSELPAVLAALASRQGDDDPARIVLIRCWSCYRGHRGAPWHDDCSAGSA